MTASPLTVIGLAACDTCRKARSALAADGHDVTLRDQRAEPLTSDEIDDLLARFGDALVNRRSTTWRGLSEDERARPPADLLVAHPALMKRPVIRTESGAHLGWTAEIRAALSG
ncbi:hypothetical protein E2L08_04020 [Palleronia sediminis]|uniref:Arsenate reductase n=1 Tax=Palleronia sediminis TaxID=2547833 RepID=A0A4V3BA55_9RHOB|nr:ArsC/Spx/MgsR family protein [Palleronia sediminis]TDL81829.1 hypothetical protein E2L08_04020 [Palleronia sediminis]